MLRSVYVLVVLNSVACGGIVGPLPGASTNDAIVAGDPSSDDAGTGARAAAPGDDDDDDDEPYVTPTIINPGACHATDDDAPRTFAAPGDVLAALGASGGSWGTCLVTTSLSFRKGTIGLDFEASGAHFLFSDGNDGFATRTGAHDAMTAVPSLVDDANHDVVDLTLAGHPTRRCRVSLFADPTQMRLTDVATGLHADYVLVEKELH